MTSIVGGSLGGLVAGPTTEPRGAPAAAYLPAVRSRLRKWSPYWPLTAAVVGYPIWWALGLSEFIWVIMAVPMCIHLARRRPIRLPRGFAWWGLFCVWVVISVVALNWHAPGTLPSSSDKLFGYGLRLLNYLAQAVALLYVGNLTEREMPRFRVVRMLAIFYFYALIGGWLGVLDKRFSFTAPLDYVLPHKLRSNSYVNFLLRPASAQVQSILGYASARPKAPFDYTNTWGVMLFVLGVYFVVRWWVWGTRRQRIVAVVGLAAALPPAVYSLDRGLWVAVGIAVVYVAVRLALRGKLAAILGIAGALAIGGLVFVASPLNTIISQRLAHPKSNDLRTSLSEAAFRGALESPIIGWGSDRELQGAPQSIQIGKSVNCPMCGNFGIGSNGQLWLTMFSQGLVGAFLYTMFFLVVFFRSWRDFSVIGTAGSLIILVSLFFNAFYSGVGVSLEIYMITAALLWRNQRAAEEGLAGSRLRPSEVPPAAASA